jgi:uncharacterized membrane protein YbhN (UPF0104 family)
MSSDRRINFVWNAVKILFSGSLVWYFLSWVNLNELFSVRERINPVYLAVTVFLYVVLTLFKAYKYQVLIQQKTKYLRVLNIVIIQNALSNFLMNSAGVASYFALLRFEEKVKLRRSGLVFAITKIGDLFSIWVVSIICSWLLWDRILVLRTIILVSLIVFGLGFVVFFAGLFWRKGFILLINRVLTSVRLTRFLFFRDVENALISFSEMPHGLVFEIVLKAFGLSFLYYLLTLLWMVVSMKAFQLPADSLVILFVSCILQLLSMIPVNVFGGLGITEITSLYLYSLFGIAQNELSIVLVGWRIFFYITNLIVVLYLPIYAIFIERNISSE